MPDNQEVTQEIAKTAGKAVDLLRDAGPFIDRMFGPLVENGIGIVSDQIRYLRLVLFFNLKDKTEARLAMRGVEVSRPVPPKFALPLIEAATLEEDETLHNRWANLLANAMDPKFDEELHPAFISILKEMSSLDALLLEKIEHEGFQPTDTLHGSFFGGNLYALQDLADLSGGSIEETEISLFNMSRLGCLSPVHSMDGTVQHITAMTSHTGITIAVTPLGRALIRACS